MLYFVTCYLLRPGIINLLPNTHTGGILCSLGIFATALYIWRSLLSSHLIYKNTKVKIYGTVTLPVDSYGCESWTVMLMEGGRLRVRE